MYEVLIVNGEGEKVMGPFETMTEAASEKERWEQTGGCTKIQIRPVKVASEDATPKPVKKK